MGLLEQGFMTMTTMTRSDENIATDVTEELFFDPQVTVGEVRVEVDNGRVTLTGIADSYETKWAAERAAFRESGVRSVHNLITVDSNLKDTPTDAELASSIRLALDWHVSIPAGRLQVLVLNGDVALSGNVDWFYQRLAAEKAVAEIRGVRSVTSHITLSAPKASPTEISEGIRGALVRSAQVDASQITVKVDHNKVTLSGKVRSWAERTEALHAAWRAKGVVDVSDDISIEP